MIRRLLPLTIALCLAATAAGAAEAKRVAFFGFALINSSMEPTSDAENARLVMLNDLYRERLTASGAYAFVDIPAETLERLAKGPEIHNCNGCDLDVAREVGADLSAWGTVQKVSNLILNINLYMTDAKTGEGYFVRSVDIRGNTDESWRHGLNYMLKNYLLKTP